MIWSIFQIGPNTVPGGNPLTTPGSRGTPMNLVTVREVVNGSMDEMDHFSFKGMGPYE